MTRYKIIRQFLNHPTRTLRRGLTLEEAQAHCRHPDTASSTATTAQAERTTAAQGPWRDCYEEEDTHCAAGCGRRAGPAWHDHCCDDCWPERQEGLYVSWRLMTGADTNDGVLDDKDLSKCHSRTHTLRNVRYGSGEGELYRDHLGDLYPPRSPVQIRAICGVAIPPVDDTLNQRWSTDTPHGRPCGNCSRVATAASVPSTSLASSLSWVSATDQ